MGDTELSQEEINALFNDVSGGSNGGDSLTPKEMDIIGEVANISMGTAATTLFSLLNQKVEISTPVVSESTWGEIVDMYEKPCVLVKIGYTKGLDGSNVLVLRENDVKVITDLMMGGDGTNTDGEISELHLSAISEAMNQMMGSSATSLSTMLSKMVDISPPTSDLVDMADSLDGGEIDEFLRGTFVKIEFKLEIGDLIHSTMMQMYPINLAKQMCADVEGNMESDAASTVDEGAFDSGPAAPPPQAPAAPAAASPPAQAAPPPQGYAPPPQGYAPPPQGYAPQPMMAPQPQVNVSNAQFTPFTGGFPLAPTTENIDLIMDVPLEVTVELGRTHKSISDILEFSPGTIIELNKIAGEPIDVLVNGKFVAKGEVVVIEESFGIRITEIMK